VVVRFEVSGKVRGQGRPRFAAVGGRGRAHKSDEDRAWEARIAAAYRRAAGDGLPPAAGPVRVRVDVWRALPPSRCRGGRAEEPDTFKPDVDNVVKSVLDALSGRAWEDDRQVTFLTAEKHPREARRAEDRMVVSVWRDDGDGTDCGKVG
jgi:Holliday junction resolvase RusA-like endonuclease